MIKTIADKVYAVVNALTATTDLLTVYNYEPNQLNWYVSATITPDDSVEIIFDTDTNELEIPILISIRASVDNIDATVESDFRTLVDDIMEALRADWSLTGSAMSSKFEVRFGYLWDEQPERVAQIRWVYTVLQSI